MIAPRAFIALGLAMACLGLVVGLRGELGPAIRTAAVLASVVPGAPPTPLDAQPEPRLTELSYVSREGYRLHASLYQPPNARAAPGLVLVNGVVPEGRAYQPMIDFARALARAGFVVLVPDALDHVNYRVLPEDIGALVRGFQVLSGQPSVDPSRVGFVGFSMGGSLAIVAAADPAIAADAALVAAVGAYDSLEAMLRAVTTQTVQTDDGFQPYQPDAYVWLVTRNTLLTRLPRAADRDAMFRLFSQNTPDPDPQELAAGRARALGPQAQRVYALLTNRNPAAVTRLAARVRAALPGALESISPRNHLHGLQAPLALLHDRGDRYVPAQESQRIYQRLGGEPRARLALLDVIQHAQLATPDLSPPVLLGSFAPGMWRLFQFTHQALGTL